jgi:hypothetical protein
MPSSYSWFLSPFPSITMSWIQILLMSFLLLKIRENFQRHWKPISIDIIFFLCWIILQTWREEEERNSTSRSSWFRGHRWVRDLMNSKIQPIFIAAMVRKIVRYLLETYCLSTFVSFLAFNTNVNLFIRSKINVDRRLWYVLLQALDC